VFLCGREITYPEGSNIVLDITQAPYSADPTGVEDVGPIIEQAVRDSLAQSGPAGSEAAPIVYFPNGRYRIATPVVLETRQEGAQWRMLQGQSRDGVILFSDANDPDFQDPENPVALISYFEGPWTNNAFTNLFENFTVEIGAGNPGAVGVRFHGNNVARMENVVIRSLDPEGAGAVGLDLKESISAPGIIKRVEVDGFDIGVDLANPTTSAQGWTIDKLTTRNQNLVGILSHRKAVQVTKWVSENTVPAYISQFRDGMVTLIGAELMTPEGELSDSTAIIMNGDFLYLRDVSMSGYANLLNDDGVLVESLGAGEAYRNGPVYSVWEDALEDFAELPIEEIPDVPWEGPEAWTLVDPEAQGDDTEALQAALSSGAKTIFLLPGLFEITDSLYVGPNVQRIASNWARIQWRGDLFESGRAIFYWEESNHDLVTIDRIAANWWQNSDEYLLHNASNADVVLRDLFWVGGGVYRNEPAGGRLFIENCHNVPGGQVFRNDLPSYVIINQNTWARQFNPEMAWPLLTVDGGTFWVSGFKYGEQQGPVVIAKNQAIVEMLGGYMNVTHGVDLEPIDLPLIWSEDAQVSLRFIERAAESNGPPSWNFRHRNIAWDIRGGEERILPTQDPSVIHRDSISRNGPGRAGAMVPLYTNLYDPELYPQNAAPVIEATASSAATVSGGAMLLATAFDHDGPAGRPAVHWRKVSGPGAAYFEDASGVQTIVSVSRPGTYGFVATAKDGFLKADSEVVEIEFLPEETRLIFARDRMQRLADLPPRDGEADNALASIFLFAGDFSVSGNVPEQEIRVHLETSIKQWAGQQDQIASARLHITPKKLNNPVSLDLVRTREMDFGLVSAADFAASADVITTLVPDSIEENMPLEIDVTDALKAALVEGRDGFGLQLRSTSGPNDDGTSNYTEFYAANPGTPERNPSLVVELVNPPVFPFAQTVAWLSTGDGYQSTLGYVNDTGEGWWFHYGLSRFIYPYSGATDASLWIYIQSLGWCWTAEAYYPYLYRWEDGSWLLPLLDSNDFWFFNLNTNEWEQITPA
jgi:hypothetical protein